MEHYFLLRFVHIVSSTLLFGTGMGTAFFALAAHRSGSLPTIALTWRHVVWADSLFTWPAVILQPLSGYLLARALGMPLDTPWLLSAMLLYVLIGACWLPVLWLQARLRDLAATALQHQQPLPPLYRRYFAYWFALGWPAFLAVLGIFWLMVFKPGLWG